MMNKNPQKSKVQVLKKRQRGRSQICQPESEASNRCGDREEMELFLINNTGSSWGGSGGRTAEGVDVLLSIIQSNLVLIHAHSQTQFKQDNQFRHAASINTHSAYKVQSIEEIDCYAHVLCSSAPSQAALFCSRS